MKLEERHSDLAELVKGSSYTQLFQALYTLASIRYGHRTQLRAVNFKVFSHNKLTKLVHLGYLTCKAGGVFSVTAKCLELLKDNGYPTAHLSADLTGSGGVEELRKSAVKLEALKLPDIYRLIYPNFTYLIPDFGLVFKKENQAKLVFVEVEEEKPKWREYLENKRANYLRLATDRDIYSVWWAHQCKILGLAQCKEAEFAFSVWCIGKVNYDWQGWSFNSSPVPTGADA